MCVRQDQIVFVVSVEVKHSDFSTDRRQNIMSIKLTKAFQVVVNSRDL